ncbi:MAG: hypothetical protein B7Z26_03110 [Asticcacaulis sp. 32-58-5]|nr:MAG: hypothetical protein B7Z26_03110 [Asticcacaulis sp. 32-58-5]
MKTLRNKIYNLYRRWFGRYTLDDPRINAKEAPYTYYIPSSARTEAVQPGDSVQLVFRGHPGGQKWDVERMWVEVTARTDAGFEGNLDNDPSDMPQLKAGDFVRFQPFHVISIQTERDQLSEPASRTYWERCMVDKCVREEKTPVYYLYREEPDMDEPDDEYPDSGWRIRGDYRHISDDELDARKAEYIAIGKVLNADDSWLHLIDEPIGSAFMRNFDTGEYEVYDRASHD